MRLALKVARKAIPVGLGPVLRPWLALIEMIIERIEALEARNGGKDGGS